MQIKEANVTITIDNGKEMENLCRHFCVILGYLDRLKGKKSQSMHLNSSETVLEILARQLETKIREQFC